MIRDYDQIMKERQIRWRSVGVCRVRKGGVSVATGSVREAETVCRLDYAAKKKKKKSKRRFEENKKLETQTTNTADMKYGTSRSSHSHLRKIIPRSNSVKEFALFVSSSQTMS